VAAQQEIEEGFKEKVKLIQSKQIVTKRVERPPLYKVQIDSKRNDNIRKSLNNKKLEDQEESKIKSPTLNFTSSQGMLANSRSNNNTPGLKGEFEMQMARTQNMPKSAILQGKIRPHTAKASQEKKELKFETD